MREHEHDHHTTYDIVCISLSIATNIYHTWDGVDELGFGVLGDCFGYLVGCILIN